MHGVKFNPMSQVLADALTSSLFKNLMNFYVLYTFDNFMFIMSYRLWSIHVMWLAL